jgi:hypothetical protein
MLRGRDKSFASAGNLNVITGSSSPIVYSHYAVTMSNTIISCFPGLLFDHEDGGSVVNIRYVFRVSLQLLFKMFFVPINISRDVQTHQSLHVKSLFLFDFKQN